MINTKLLPDSHHLNMFSETRFKKMKISSKQLTDCILRRVQVCSNFHCAKFELDKHQSATSIKNTL